MTPDAEHRSPSDVVRAFLAGATSGDEAFALVAEDFVNHAAGPQGRAGLLATRAVLDHDLDLHRAEVHHVVADGDLVVVHLTLHARHRASTMPLLQGVPVTERDVAWTFMHLFRVADGEIVEHWATRDDLGLLRQLGAWPVPPPPSTSSDRWSTGCGRAPRGVRRAP